MKRILTLLIVSALLVTVPSAYAEATHRRGVIEFSELYMYRFMKLQRDSDLEYSIHVLEQYSPPMSFDDHTVLLNSAAGSMEVNTTDYTVSTITMTFVDINDSDEKNEQNAMSCMMALSALEYNETDELKMRVNSKLYGGSETAAEEALRLLDLLSDTIVDAMQRAIDTGEEVKILSGNYDYFIAYDVGNKSGREYEYFYLVASEHE